MWRTHVAGWASGLALVSWLTTPWLISPFESHHRAPLNPVWVSYCCGVFTLYDRFLFFSFDRAWMIHNRQFCLVKATGPLHKMPIYNKQVSSTLQHLFFIGQPVTDQKVDEIFFFFPLWLLSSWPRCQLITRNIPSKDHTKSDDGAFSFCKVRIGPNCYELQNYCKKKKLICIDITVDFMDFIFRAKFVKFKHIQEQSVDVKVWDGSDADLRELLDQQP